MENSASEIAVQRQLGAERGAVGALGGKIKRASGLAADTASRLARAEEMGLRTDMPLYHGTNAEFSSFRAAPTTAKGMETPRVSLALDPEVANEFAVAKQGSGQTNPQVYQVFHRAENPATLKLDGDESHGEVVGTLRDLFDAGHDAVIINHTGRPNGKEYHHRQGRVTIAIAAGHVRSGA